MQLENTGTPGLQFRASVSDGVERLTAMHNRKKPSSLEFRAVLTEGTEIFELSKA